MSDSTEPTKPRRRTTAAKGATAKSGSGASATPAKPTAKKSSVKSDAKSSTRTARTRRAAASPVTAEERHRMIAEAAYLIAESRGFDNSRSLDDWLEAEAQIDSILSGTTRH